MQERFFGYVKSLSFWAEWRGQESEGGNWEEKNR